MYYCCVVFEIPNLREVMDMSLGRLHRDKERFVLNSDGSWETLPWNSTRDTGFQSYRLPRSMGISVGTTRQGVLLVAWSKMLRTSGRGYPFL